MYSPKIAEDLVRRLYWLGKERKLPMTRLVNELLRSALDAKGHSEIEQRTVEVSEQARKAA